MQDSYMLFRGLGPPAPPTSGRSILSSVAIHCALLAALLTLGSRAVIPELTGHREHLYIALEPAPVSTPRVSPKPAHLAEPNKARVEPPKLYTPPRPAPPQKAAIMPAPPKIMAEAKPPSPNLHLEPPKPITEPIQTGLFQPVATAANVNPKLTVETGNFLGPAPTREGITDHQIAAVGGFGGAQSADRGSDRPGAVRSAGFGQTAAAKASRASQGAPASAGFAAPVVEEAHRTAATQDQGARSVAIILEKPRPAYTEEARRLRIEGEVLVEVLFAADGKARVQRVIRGLGHGLDESAEKAAEGIRFRPAMRGGTPVDSVAIAHIEFQLAY
jgi:TonB family protein